MLPARRGQGRAGPRGREEIKEPVHVRQGVLIRSWLLRQLQAGLRPGSDRGLCVQCPSMASLIGRCVTQPLVLTEYGERVVWVKGFYTAKVSL